MKQNLELSWQKAANGVYKTTVGEIGPNFKTLLDYTDSKPKLDTINSNYADTCFPFAETGITARKVNGKLVLNLPFTHSEKIYGFGLHYRTLNQKGKVLNLKTDHYAGTDNGRAHAPCPVYFSSNGYGVFFNTPTPLTVYVGTAGLKGPKTEALAKDRNNDKTWTSLPITDYIEVSLNAENLEVIVFNGNSVVDSVARYNLYCGGGFLPPKWGLGFWYRFASLKDQPSILKELEEFTEHNIQVDVVGLEPGWMSKSYPCTFEWDKVRFPDPKQLCDNLAEQGARVNLWVNPYISPSARVYKPMYNYSATHTVWCGLVPDYTLAEARNIVMQQHIEDHVKIGASGYKIDECDGYDKWLWPDHAEFPSGTDAEDMRQLLGVLMQKMTTELYKVNNLRTYGLVRASNSSGSAYPYTIYNDKYDFNEYMVGLLNSGFSGVSWVPEIRHGKDASDWLRRFQMALFSPMLLLNSWASGAKPWTNAEVAQDLTDIIKFRKMLLPYLYNAYAKFAFTGVPPFRAMAMEYPHLNPAEKIKEAVLHDTDNPYLQKPPSEVNDQLLIGDCLMAAFLRPGETERYVILPEGNWYNFYTKEFAGTNTVIRIEADNKVPLFVREGGMIPLETEDGTLTVKCYGAKGECTLYDDDGETYNFEKGMYNEIKLSFERNGAELKHSAEYVRENVKKNYTNFVFE